MQPRDSILQQAMSLTSADQAYLVQVLEEHLADQIPVAVEMADGVAGSAFLAELERRSHAYKAGKMTSRPAGEVLADMHTRQRTETSQ